MKKLLWASLCISFVLLKADQEEVITCKQCDDIAKVIRVYKDEVTKKLLVEVSTAEGTLTIPEEEYKNLVLKQVNKFLKESKFRQGETLYRRATPIFEKCRWPQQLEEAKRTFNKQPENK